MICPFCGSAQTGVVDSRQRGDARRRTYRCGDCDGRFYTTERVDTDGTPYRRRPRSACDLCALKRSADARCETCDLARAAARYAARHKTETETTIWKE